jgi:hypothetical protein
MISTLYFAGAVPPGTMEVWLGASILPLKIAEIPARQETAALQQR